MDIVLHTTTLIVTSVPNSSAVSPNQALSITFMWLNPMWEVKVLIQLTLTLGTDTFLKKNPSFYSKFELAVKKFKNVLVPPESSIQLNLKRAVNKHSFNFTICFKCSVKKLINS